MYGEWILSQLADGRKIRTLTIADLFTRECLGIEVGLSLRAEHVVAAVNRLKHDRGLPQQLIGHCPKISTGPKIDH